MTTADTRTPGLERCTVCLLSRSCRVKSWLVLTAPGNITRC